MVSGRLRRDPRVELAERTRRGVAGIGEGGISLFRPGGGSGCGRPPAPCRPPPGPRSFPGRAAVSRLRGWPDPSVRGNGEGNGGDRPEVQRDVFAYGAVSARRSDRERAAFVEEIDGETVELRLHDVADRLVAPQKRRQRRSNSRISSSEKALARLSIGVRWVTVPNFSSGGAPTRRVGESGVGESGELGLQRLSSRMRRSYSASEISGSSSW